MTLLHDPDLRRILIASIGALLIAGIAGGLIIKCSWSFGPKFRCVVCGVPVDDWMSRCSICEDAVTAVMESMRAPDSGFMVDSNRDSKSEGM
jgi:hypothetical protein